MKSPELFTIFSGFNPTDGGSKGKGFVGDAVRRQKKLAEMIGLIKKTQKFCIGLQEFRDWLVELIEAPDMDPFESAGYKVILEKFDDIPELQGKKE